jgi:pimeloyl-[acyl-carrier protein] methyl ester esterase
MKPDLAYSVTGNGETLVFLHGWGVDRRVWRQQAKYFGEDFRVVTMDFPGHGESPWEPSTLEEIAAGVFEVLDKEKIAAADFIGSSFGGLVSIQCWGLQPRRVKRLSLVGSLPRFAKSADYPCGLDIAQLRKMSGQLETDYPSIVDIFFRSLFTKWERETRRYHWIQRFRRDITPPQREAMRAYLRILETSDLTDTLRRVTVPVQIMLGSHDPICGESAENILRAIVPDANFFIFRQCGHFPFLSQPVGFNKMLDDFLQSTNGGDGC